MDKGKTIYDSLRKEPLLDRGVSFTYRDKGRKSEAFLIPKGKPRYDFLLEAFGISDPFLFKKKYAQAISGSGNAEKDFDALKSSALCALLCFYRVRKLRIGEVTYDTSYFEVKNSVLGNPSNMDVVLTGIDDEGRSAVLFLECKFSEYLDNGIETVSGKYFSGQGRRYFDAVKEAGLGKYCSVDEGKTYHFFTPRAYSQGTKQVISHLLGLSSFLNREEGYCGELYKGNVLPEGREALYEGHYQRVAFRELLFDFKTPEFHKTLEEYRGLSNDVRKAFEDLIPEGLSFEEPLTYQELFAMNGNHEEVDPLVAEFYGL